MGNLTSKAYPSNDTPPKTDIPLYMPLKVAFIGDRLSGKSTIAEKIANKYGIICINPRNIIKEAVELNK